MLDEPTVGADVETRRQLIEAVRALAAEGAGVLYTTHYLPEVDALDAEIVIIDEGRILAHGTRSELIASYYLGGLRFTVDGPIDPGRLDGLQVERVGPVDYVAVGEVTMAALLDRFDGQADRLLSVERNRPDLESVFLAVTGRDIDEDDE